MPHHPEGADASDPTKTPSQVTGTIGPRTVTKSRQTCDGCSALKTKYWTFYGENDDIDSGTDATCTVADKSISGYWSVLTDTPDWCPAPKPPAALARPAPAVPEEVRAKIERAYKDGYREGARNFIGNDDDEEEVAESQDEAWGRYAAASIATPPERVAEGKRDSVSASEDWLNTPIGGDLLFLGMRFAKGVRLRTVIEAARRWRAASLTSRAARPATAADSRAVPEGWQLVPLDDTGRSYNDSGLPLAMIEAGADALDRLRADPSLDLCSGALAVGMYRAMLDASPAAPDPAPAAQGGGDGWLPIKTAPKRGGKFAGPAVLVWAEGYLEPELAQWEPDTYAKSPRPYWSLVGCRTMDSRSRQPTRWRPLPAPPSPAISTPDEGK